MAFNIFTKKSANSLQGQVDMELALETIETRAEKKVDALQSRVNMLDNYNRQLILETMRLRGALEEMLGRKLTDEEIEFFMSGNGEFRAA